MEIKTTDINVNGDGCITCECSCMPDGHPFEIRAEVQIKKIKDNAIIPTRGTNKAAGYDLYACESTTIQPHTTEKIGTGLSMALPHGTFGAVFARSGLATKQGLRPANCVGVCDEDYRGEYIIALHNDTNEVKEICAGDRIAQLILLPYLPINFIETETLDEDSERGNNAFGSTGK